MARNRVPLDQIRFVCTYIQDDLEVRGNTLASGDDAADRAEEDQILERLASGDETAWCRITVEARWHDLVGVASVGACCLSPDDSVQEYAKDQGLYDDARAELERTVRQYLADAKTIRAALR